MLSFTVSLRTPNFQTCHSLSVPKSSLCHLIKNHSRKLGFTSPVYKDYVIPNWCIISEGLCWTTVFHKVKFSDSFAWMHPTKTFPFLASLLKKHKPNLIHDAQQSAWGVLLWIASTSGTAAKIKWTKEIQHHPCLYYVLKLQELNPSCEQGLLSHLPLPLTYSV